MPKISPMSRAGPPRNGRPRKPRPEAARRSTNSAAGKSRAWPFSALTEENRPLFPRGELSQDIGGVRTACGDDRLSVRQPAIACRFRLVRPAQRNGDRPDADADHAGAGAVHRIRIGSAVWMMRQASRASGIRASARSAAGSSRSCESRANSICRSSSLTRERLPAALNGCRSTCGACVMRCRRSSIR